MWKHGRHLPLLAMCLTISYIQQAGAQATGAAGATVDLQWKFEKGKSFFQELSTDTKQSMKIMGMDIAQSQKQTFYFSWTPKEEDKDHNWTIKQRIEGVKIDVDIAGNKVAFDSTKGAGVNNPLP